MYTIFSNNNRAFNAGNAAQGTFKKVLVVCSAGLLRSPTMAWVLSNTPYNFNTRSCGANPRYALIHLDDVLLEWADVVIFVNKEVEEEAKRHCNGINFMPKEMFVTLDIPDNYNFRSPELVNICQTEANKLFGE